MAISFYLIALLMLYGICVEKKDKLLYYIVFSLCLTWGLYTVTSNLYWVVPVCFVGGIYLLLKKEIKKKLGEDWKFTMKQYQDMIALEQQRINVMRDIAIAYANSRPKENLNIFWK